MNLESTIIEQKVTGNPNLNYFLEKKVEQLVTPENYFIDEGMKERHKLYSLLLMSITKFYWNGNKRGREGINGTYNNHLPVSYGNYEFNDYLGHNIASIAIDGVGSVIDFEFNHNKIYNSSTEHAESRMVRRVFSLTQINDSWKTSNVHKPKDDARTFEDVTLYTTLESCSQCAGVMALAKVKEIVYLQTDPGMYLIGNILRNLTRKIDEAPGSHNSLLSPMPISGLDINFEHFSKLNENYKEYCTLVQDVPFFTPKVGSPEKSPSITSFLCTKYAYEVYNDAFIQFDLLKKDELSYPDYKPTNSKGEIIESAMPNSSVLNEVKDFYQYATLSGRRATPHK